MARFHAVIAVLIIPAVLAACGGGGGTPGNSTPTPAPTATPTAVPGAPYVSALEPQALVATAVEGSAVELNYAATSADGMDVLAVVASQASGEAIQAAGYQGLLARSGSQRVDVRAVSKSTLPPGVYEGTLQVAFCVEERCPKTGKPVILPYKITVLARAQPALSRWPQAADWETVHGNAAHDSYVPVSIDASKITPRWVWQIPIPRYAPGAASIVTGNGLAYFSMSLNTILFQSFPFFALHEGDATEQWQWVGSPDFAPALGDGKIWRAVHGTSDNVEQSLFFIQDALTGTSRGRDVVPYSYTHDRYSTPAVYGGVAYSTHLDGITAMAADGTHLWNAGSNGPGEATMDSPAVDAANVYHFTASGTDAAAFKIIDRASGALKAQIVTALPGDEVAQTHGTIVLTGNKRALVTTGRYPAYPAWQPFAANNKLLCFDLAGGKLAWSLSLPYANDSGVRQGAIYTTFFDGSRMQVRNESDGKLQWEWRAPADDVSGMTGAIVLTDTLAFVSSRHRTYAVDLATHATVWSIDIPASKANLLALSANGVLYIGNNAMLYAFNVK